MYCVNVGVRGGASRSRNWVGWDRGCLIPLGKIQDLLGLSGIESDCQVGTSGGGGGTRKYLAVSNGGEKGSGYSQNSSRM